MAKSIQLGRIVPYVFGHCWERHDKEYRFWKDIVLGKEQATTTKEKILVELHRLWSDDKIQSFAKADGRNNTKTVRDMNGRALVYMSAQSDEETLKLLRRIK